MLLVANANAENKGLTNYHTQPADVSELPFEDNAFNAISCRMGFMFFPDMQQAANEMYRVLKPGGRVATSVWAAPDQNDWVTTIMSVIQKHVKLPPPPAGAPGMFRCAKPRLIAGLFINAGFKNITESTITGTVDYGSFNQYWNMMLEVGAPIVAAMAQADEETKATIKVEVSDLFQLKNEAGGSVLSYSSIVIAGEK